MAKLEKREVCVTLSDRDIRMHGIADERATRWMEGEEKRRQVDVVFGIGQISVPKAARHQQWRT